MTWRTWALALTLCVLTGAAGLPGVAAAAAPAAPDYADPAAWLCRPGRADDCAQPITSTIVTGAGRSRTAYTADPAAPVDCFYVYPTVSRDTAANADIAAGPEEHRVVTSQFARFAGQCRPFAPLYRQATLAALKDRTAQPGLAYADVLAAWRRYMAHDNHGRGVVLIGHSQGAFLLTRLIAQEIDGKPAQRQLVSAILLGGNVQVAPGKDVGGAFRRIPLCRRAGQTGCVVAYSTYLASDPPDAGARFGAPREPGQQVACVNPAALTGHAALDAELPTVGRVATTLGTVLVENPGLLSGECVQANGHSVLAIAIKPGGAGADLMAKALGDLSARSHGWGLHPLDVNLALGDLVAIVDAQGKAWTAR